MSVLRVTQNVLLPDAVNAQNVFFWRTDPDVGPGDEATVSGHIQSAIETIFNNVLSRIHNGTVFADFVVEVLDGITFEWDFYTSGSVSLSPTAAGDALANGIAGLIELELLLNPRTAKKYVAGLAENAANDNNLNSGALTDLGNMAVAWATTYVFPGAFDYIPGIWSETFDTWYEGTGTSIVNSFLGYQRRRKPGVGI